MKRVLLRNLRVRPMIKNQRSILFYQDQEDKFLKLKKEHNLNMSFGEASRMAFDMFLDALEEEIKNEIKDSEPEDK